MKIQDHRNDVNSFLKLLHCLFIFSCFLMFLASRQESLWAAPQSEAVRWKDNSQLTQLRSKWVATWVVAKEEKNSVRAGRGKNEKRSRSQRCCRALLYISTYGPPCSSCECHDHTNYRRQSHLLMGIWHVVFRGFFFLFSDCVIIHRWCNTQCLHAL